MICKNTRVNHNPYNIILIIFSVSIFTLDTSHIYLPFIFHLCARHSLHWNYYSDFGSQSYQPSFRPFLIRALIIAVIASADICESNPSILCHSLVWHIWPMRHCSSLCKPLWFRLRYIGQCRGNGIGRVSLCFWTQWQLLWQMEWNVQCLGFAFPTNESVTSGMDIAVWWEHLYYKSRNLSPDLNRGGGFV